jgi:hypothetical protein
LLALADDATTKLVPELTLEAEAVTADAGLVRSSRQERARVEECFKKGIPAQHVVGIESVVNAAWNFFLSGMDAWQRRYPDFFDTTERPLEMLSDLVFKTVEVLEIETRTGHSNAGS